MTREKKLKKAIRARSLKTGESYTAARRNLLAAQRRQRADSTRAPAPTPVVEARPARTAARAASSQKVVSDAAVVDKTGHDLEHWFGVLDRFGTAEKGYTESARHLLREHRVAPWYAQAITLSYQRARGLRAVNQAADGGFQVSVSRVVPASVPEIIEALSSRRRRAAWLKSTDAELAAALDGAFIGSKPQRVRVKDERNAVLRFRWGKSVAEIYITGKAKGGATVVAWHTKLAGPAEVDTRRKQWRTAIDALKQHLGG